MSDKHQRNSLSNSPGNGKIQGEGDYEAARRFNKEERDFVKQGAHSPTHLNKDEVEEGKNAEARGKARAKDGGHDKKDAELMKRDARP